MIAPEIGQFTDIVLSCPTAAFSGVHSVINASNWYSGFDCDLGAFSGLTTQDTFVPTRLTVLPFPLKNSSRELSAKS